MKKKTGKKKNLFSVVNYTVLVLTVIAAVYIMANGLGLIDSLDFGGRGILLCGYSSVCKICRWIRLHITDFHVGAHCTVPDLGILHV